jgi:DNA-binding response OmpR family regulator
MPAPLGRILVVDDEPQLNAMLCEALAGMQYDVKGVIDGARALEMVPVFQPDLVLLDLNMGGMPGMNRPGFPGGSTP